MILSQFRVDSELVLGWFWVIFFWFCRFQLSSPSQWIWLQVNRWVPLCILTKLFHPSSLFCTSKNQTMPPFFHACHSLPLIKFEYFSRQKLIRGVNKFVVYDLAQSCSCNKPHILGTKIQLHYTPSGQICAPGGRIENYKPVLTWKIILSVGGIF